MRDTTKTLTLEELSVLTKSKMVGDSTHAVTGVDSLESATTSDVSFLANLKYKEAMHTSRAGVICITPNLPLVEGKNYLISEDPSRTFQQIAEILYAATFHTTAFNGTHPTAVVHPSAKIGNNVNIGPYVVIDQDVHIDDDTILGPFVSIGPGVKIGKSCQFYAHVVVREGCHIGNRVILQPGAIIGSCGFGYTIDKEGRYHKLEQLGTVIIKDDVEIGANTTIDRARFKQTTISQGTKIDNLVQIGHNVHLGENNIIVSQSGIAGSAKTGKNVALGGQAGIVGHLEITDNVMIATRGGVSKSINQSGKYAGGPVMPLADYNRTQVHLRKITGYVKKIEQLEKRLKELEEKLL